MVGIEPRFLRSSTQNGRAPSAGAGGASGIISRLTVVASVAAFERHSSRLGCRSEQRSSPPAESRRYVSAAWGEGKASRTKNIEVSARFRPRGGAEQPLKSAPSGAESQMCSGKRVMKL